MTSKLEPTLPRRIYPKNFITRLSDFGLLQITGSDAASFLQGQLTCDVREVTSKQAKLGAICTAQGRVQSIFILFQQQQNYYLLLPQTNVQPVMERLKKYILSAKVELTTITAETTQALAVRGSLASALNLEVPNTDYACNQSDWLAITYPDTEKHFILLANPEHAEKLIQHYKQNVVQQEVWHYYRLQQKIPLIYPETEGLFTPHDLNLPHLNAISFTKGCYCGQEIVARMQYRAQLKQHTYYAELASSELIKPGLILNNADPELQATVVDALEIQQDCYIGLVFMLAAAAQQHKLVYKQTTLTIFDVYAS